MNQDAPGRLFESSKISCGRRTIGNDTKFANTSNSLDINKTIYQFKIIILGNVSVGKTCLLSRFIDNKFTEDYKCNVGVEFKIKTLPIDKSTVADLKIWDTCGSEKYRSITNQYFRDASGIILMFDLTNRASFDDLKVWLDDIHENASKNIVVFLVGNKSDMTNMRKISQGEAAGFSQSNHMNYLDVSAKNGTNVSLVFDKLANLLIKNLKDNEIDDAIERGGYAKKAKATNLNLNPKNNTYTVSNDTKEKKCCS